MSSVCQIQDFPDLAILKVFDNLPLLDLIHIDEVCSRWRKLKAPALLRRKHLIIVRDETDLKSLEHPNNSFSMLRLVKNDDGSPYCKIKVRLDRHALYVSEIKPTMLDNIVEMMPHLKVIRIIHRDGNYHELFKIKYLLQQYRHQLVDVTLWFRESFNNENAYVMHYDFKSMFVSLMNTLNSMTALDYLELNLESPISYPATIPVDLSITSRLKVLNIRTNGFAGQGGNNSSYLQQTFEQYCETNVNLEEIFTNIFMPLETALANGPRVSSAFRVVHLDGAISSNNLHDFKKFANQYCNILNLTISVTGVSMDKIASALAPCANLIHLTLVANFDELKGPVLSPNEVEPDKLTVLSSVKFLSLILDTGSHTHFERLNLDIIFSNVQVIFLQHYCRRCPECNYHITPELDRAQVNALSPQVRECMRMARISFMRFPKLICLKGNISLLGHVTSIYHDFTKENLDMDTTHLEEEAFEENDS